MFNFSVKPLNTESALQIDLEGALISAFDARKLKEVCTTKLNTLQNVVVNCRKLKAINSEGLNVLLHLFTICRNRDGNFVMCNVQQDISQILLYTKIKNIFTITPDLKAAKKALAVN